MQSNDKLWWINRERLWLLCRWWYNKSYFGIGSNKGPLTAVCKPGKWTTSRAKCKELKDKAKCELANNDCMNIPEEHKDLWILSTNGKVMPYKVIGGNKMVKYKSDSCNYNWQKANVKGPILVGDDWKICEKQSCIIPYHATGPHSQSCLAKMERYRMGGEKPYMRKMEASNSR